MSRSTAKREIDSLRQHLYLPSVCALALFSFTDARLRANALPELEHLPFHQHHASVIANFHPTVAYTTTPACARARICNYEARQVSLPHPRQSKQIRVLNDLPKAATEDAWLTRGAW